MLYLEGKWRKGRSPLNALPLDVPFALSPQDAALLDFLESLNDGDTPAMLMLNLSQFAELLPKLIGHPRVTSWPRATRGNLPANRSSLPSTPSLEKNGEIVLRLASRVARPGIIPGATAWVLQGPDIAPLGLPLGLGQLFSGPMRITRATGAAISQHRIGRRLSPSCDVQANFDVGDFEMEAATPRFKLHLAGGLAMLEAKLECYYGDKRVVPGAVAQNEAFWLPDPESPTRYRTRNFEAGTGRRCAIG